MTTTIGFFLYSNSGDVFCMLPSTPDNADYLATGDIVHDGKYHARGVKWANVSVWESSVGVSVPDDYEMHAWRYDATTNELVDLGVIEEVA